MFVDELSVSELMVCRTVISFSKSGDLNKLVTQLLIRGIFLTLSQVGVSQFT